MADGKQWTTRNLNVNTAPSDRHEMRTRIAFNMAAYTHGNQRNEDANRWEMVWRLPTNDEWRQMAKRYGGVREDSNDTGEAA